MTAILYSKIATLWMHIMALIDTKLICLEYTLIELRNNLHISIETEVRTHIGIILILLSQQIPLLIVYEVLIKSILLTMAFIHLVTFHLMIYAIKSHHWCNLCTKCIHNWTKLYVFSHLWRPFWIFQIAQGWQRATHLELFTETL